MERGLAENGYEEALEDIDAPTLNSVVHLLFAAGIIVLQDFSPAENQEYQPVLLFMHLISSQRLSGGEIMAIVSSWQKLDDEERGRLRSICSSLSSDAPTNLSTALLRGFLTNPRAVLQAVRPSSPAVEEGTASVRGAVRDVVGDELERYSSNDLYLAIEALIQSRTFTAQDFLVAHTDAEHARHVREKLPEDACRVMALSLEAFRSRENSVTALRYLLQMDRLRIEELRALLSQVT